MKRKGLIFLGIFLLSAPSMAFADFRHNNHQTPRCPTNQYHHENYSYGGGPSYYPHLPQQGFQHGPSWHPQFGPSRYDQAIEQGIRSGQLSWREVRELREDQREIGERAAAYRADGYLSPRERNSLWDDMKDFRKDLNHELNDGERRW